MKLNIATLALIVMAVIVFASRLSGLAWTPRHIVGIAIAAPSLLLLVVVARLQLGKAFSVEAKATELVTTGLYAKLRNPIYVFGMLIVVGLIVFTGMPWFLLVLGALVPLQIIRSRKESEVLEEKFGEVYREYKRQTWF